MKTQMPDRIKKFVADFHADDTAATATEYIILLILVACVIIAIVKVYGQTVQTKYEIAHDTVRKEVTY